MARLNHDVVIALIFLAVGILVHTCSIFLAPFLQFWDECFHALVAKNMLEHPFTPMLHQASEMPLKVDWSITDVWLHKPPFFLWLMTLSMKLFGASVWAARLPSALLVSLMPPMLYRMGVLVENKRVGMLAGIMGLCSYYLFELAIGYIPTDHNDVAFIVAISASFWTWLEYEKAGKLKYALLTGLFAGFAVLSKWYLGVLVFLPWVFNELFYARKQWKGVLKSVLVFASVVGAWVIPTYLRFPEKAAHEWFFKTDHLNAAIDGHRGGTLFHLDVVAELIPPWHWTIALLAIGISCWQIRSKAIRIWFIAPTLFVHALFMYAETKMLSYTMVLLPIYLIAFSVLLVFLLERFVPAQWQKNAFIVVALLVGFTSMNTNEVRENHFSETGYYADWRARNSNFLNWSKSLAESLQGKEKVALFNFESPTNIQFMFHHGHEAMFLMPTQAEVDKLMASGYEVYVLRKPNEQVRLSGVQFVAAP